MEARAKNQVKALKIASRAKCVDGIMQAPVIVVLSYSELERNFASPLHVAAIRLGVCTTALKW